MLRKSTIEMAWALLKQPALKLELFGDEQAREAYEDFTARRRILLFRRNTFGVALRDIPEEGPLFEGPEFRHFRRMARRAEKAGYTVREIEPTEHIADMMAVHRSTDDRQGRPMAPSYLDETAVRAYCRREGPYYAVFDRGGVMVAYTHAPVLGDIFLFSRIMGHDAHKDAGVMFLLVEQVMELRRGLWAMYDMFLGASNGLREFKRHCGFEPRRVKWRWLPSPRPEDFFLEDIISPA